MTKLDRLNELLEGMVTEDAYADASHELLNAKTRVHSHQLTIREMEKTLSQIHDNPKRKSALQARIKAEQDKLKVAQDHLQAKQAAFAKHKSASAPAKKDAHPQYHSGGAGTSHAAQM